MPPEAAVDPSLIGYLVDPFLGLTDARRLLAITPFTPPVRRDLPDVTLLI